MLGTLRNAADKTLHRSEKKNCPRDLHPELYCFPSSIFPRESVKNYRKTEREAVRSFCPPRSIRYFRYKVLSCSTSDFCLRMRKIKWRRLQICRSCHRARRAPRRGNGGDSLFTAKTLSDLRAAHAAQRLPSLCKPGGLQVAFFSCQLGGEV